MSNKNVPFKVFRQRKNGLSARSMEELRSEIETRETSDLIFPLEIFHPKIKPFIEAIIEHLQVPRAFVGICMLSAYSSAIGSAYRVGANRKNTLSMAIWACLEGISSSGKSYGISQIFKPFNKIQDKFNLEWEEKTHNLSNDKCRYERMDTVFYRDAHIPTLVRDILPDNSKGVFKHSDEILEWLNGMNQLSKKEGTDEQFWLSTWNGSAYSGYRSGKNKFVLPRPFVNIIGGIQPSLSWKLFEKDRGTSGFIFRLLFAVPEVNTIAEPNPFYEIPDQLEDIHAESINILYKKLPVYDPYEEPRNCILESNAIIEWDKWAKAHAAKIDRMEDLQEKSVHAGIYGKIKEYAMRFAGILAISDRAFENQPFNQEIIVRREVMCRALKAAEYFYKSATDVFDRVSKSVTAPVEVLRVATLMKLGRSISQIAEIEFESDENKYKKRMERMIKLWVKEYPKVFNANAR